MMMEVIDEDATVIEWWKRHVEQQGESGWSEPFTEWKINCMWSVCTACLDARGVEERDAACDTCTKLDEKCKACTWSERAACPGWTAAIEGHTSMCVRTKCVECSRTECDGRAVVIDILADLKEIEEIDAE